MLTVVLYGAAGAMLLIAFVAFIVLIAVLTGCALGMLPGLDVGEQPAECEPVPAWGREWLDEINRRPVVRR